MLEKLHLDLKKFFLNFTIDNINFNKILFFTILFIIFIIILIKKYNLIFNKIKTYKIHIINLVVLVLIIYLFKMKENIFFFLKDIYIKIDNENLNIISFLLSIFWVLFTFLLNIYNSFLFNFFFKNLIFLDLNYRIFIFRIFVLLLFFIILFSGFTIMKLDSLILSILGASLGISLSSNIQKIVNNYISGLIILFNKSFKIGDAININGYQGVITKINNRYTTLRNLDCSEILVPNEKFLNEIVQNQSLYFSKGNLRINVQISYNNDYKNVLKILIESLDGIERVLKNPPPISYITSLSLLGVDMELSFWILDAVRGVSLIKSDVYLNILKIFKEHDVEMSYYKKILKILN